MSLLDTFAIVFEGDTGTLDKGVQQSNKSSDDLLDSLKKVDREADKAGSSFQSMAMKAVGALAAAAGIGKTISAAIARSNDIHLMNQTAESIGVAVEEMDAFRRSVEDTGGTAQGAQDTMVKMAESIGQAMSKADSEQGKMFKAMGINLRDAEGNALNASDGLLQVAGAIEQMDQAQARFTLKQLQITDQKSVEMLLKGRQEIERMTAAHKEQGVVTKEMAQQAGRLDDAMNKMRGGLDRAGMGLMNALLPAIIKGVEWLTKMIDFANENKQVITAFFAVIAGVLMAVYVPAMLSAAVATLAATWPLLAMIAAVAAVAAVFALAYDDIMNFIDGNDSFIGTVMEKYPLVRAIFQSIGDAVKLFGQVAGFVFEATKEGVRQMIGAFMMLRDALVAVFEFIGAAWRAQIEFIMKGVDKIKGGIGAVKGFFSRGSEATTAVEAGQVQTIAAAANPLNALSSAAISNSTRNSSETTVQVGEVIVQTQATDADGIARDIGGSLNDQLADMDAEFSTGVAR